MHRLMRCMCKNLFRASEAAKDSKPQDSERKEIVLETRQGLYVDEEKSGSEIESSISGEELEGFLSTLKKNREQLSQEEQVSKPVIKTVNPNPGDIELGTSKAEKKEKAPALAEEIIPELLTHRTAPDPEKRISTVPPSTTKPPKRQTLIAPKRTAWEQFQDLSVAKQIAALSIAALPIVIVGISMTEPDAPPAPADTRISKLLQPVAERPAPLPRVEREVVVEKKVEPKVVEAPKEVEKRAQPRAYTALYQNSIEGDFENVIRLAAPQLSSLSNEEKALYFEAQLARAGRDPVRIRDIRNSIQSANSERDSDSALRRAQLTSYLRDPNAKSGAGKIIEGYRQLVMTRPRDPILFAYLGMGYEKMDRPDLAFEAWDQALTLEPQMVWLIERREQFHRNMKDYKNAMSMASRLSKISGYQAAGFTKMAEIAKLQGDESSAANFYRQSLKYKEDVKTRLALADQLSDSDKDPSKDLLAALAKAPNKATKSKILTQLGKLSCNSNQIDQGLRYLKQAVKETPNYAVAFYERGLCERKAGNAKGSASAFASALKYDPNNHQIWMQYAFSLEADGKSKPALSALQQALKIKVNDGTHLAMAQMLLKLKRQQEALVHAKKAIALNPNNQKARLLVSELEK